MDARTWLSGDAPCRDLFPVDPFSRFCDAREIWQYLPVFKDSCMATESQKSEVLRKVFDLAAGMRSILRNRQRLRYANNALDARVKTLRQCARRDEECSLIHFVPFATYGLCALRMIV
jgi:hypothetical protein